MYALIENNTFVRWVDLRRDFPDTSFPLVVQSTDLPEGVVFVDTHNPPPPGDLQVAELQPAPVFDSGKWRLDYVIRDMEAQEVNEAIATKSRQMRAERNQRLTDSDWTQVADAPVDKAAWTVYRQALRDITTQTGFPFNVRWPEEPRG